MKQNVEAIMLGDSLTAKANWQELLEKEHIINLGVDGNTTKDILQRLEPIIQIQPKRVFLMAGINDMSYSIKVDEIFQNYQSIVKQLQDAGIEVIVQITLFTTMIAINKKVTLFNEMLLEYCKEKQITYIDLNDSFCDEDGLLRQDLTTDGLHLGEKAYKAWAYKLKNYIK